MTFFEFPLNVEAERVERAAYVFRPLYTLFPRDVHISCPRNPSSCCEVVTAQKWKINKNTLAKRSSNSNSPIPTEDLRIKMIKPLQSSIHSDAFTRINLKQKWKCYQTGHKQHTHYWNPIDLFGACLFFHFSSFPSLRIGWCFFIVSFFYIWSNALSEKEYAKRHIHKYYKHLIRHSAQPTVQ